MTDLPDVSLSSSSAFVQGSGLVVDSIAADGAFAVGLSDHTDFIRAHRERRLDVRAAPVHQGRTGQLWACDITREDGKPTQRSSGASTRCRALSGGTVPWVAWTPTTS
jgi:acyl-coenzyme A thioesterase PaaI-like protein